MNSKAVQFFTPHAHQLQIINALEDPEIYYVTCIAGRQAGKTILAENFACKYCLDNPGHIAMWVSPTDNQAQKVFKEILHQFPKSSNIWLSKKAAKGDTEIVWANGSKLLFRSAGSKDSLRGPKHHLIVLDEAAFMEEATVEEIIKPTQNAVKKPKMFIISTPKGKNWLYDYYRKGLDREHKRYRSFHFTCYDSPHSNIEKIEQDRQDMTDLRFKQEYLAEFVDSASAFKNLYELMVLDEQNTPIVGEKYYAGIDIGLLDDATVLTIIDSRGDMIKYYYWERLDTNDLLDRIIEVNKLWKFKRIFIETNNQGLPIYQTLKKSITVLEGINTSSKSKPQMLDNLIQLFALKKMFVIKDYRLRTELEAFNYNPKNNKYGGIGEHDDCVMSLAIARECYERCRYNPGYWDYQFGSI